MHLTPKSRLSDFPEIFHSLGFEKDQNVRNMGDYGRGLWNQKKMTHLTLCWRTEAEREREIDRQAASQSDQKKDWLTDCSLLLLHYGGALPLPLPFFAEHIHSLASRLCSSWAESAGLGGIAQIGRRSQIRQPRFFFFFLLKVSQTYPKTTQPCTGPLHPPNQTKPNQSLTNLA